MTDHESPEICAALATWLAARMERDIRRGIAAEHMPILQTWKAGVSEVLSAVEFWNPDEDDLERVDIDIRYLDRNGVARVDHLAMVTLEELLLHTEARVPKHRLQWTVEASRSSDTVETPEDLGPLPIDAIVQLNDTDGGFIVRVSEGDAMGGEDWALPGDDRLLSIARLRELWRGEDPFTDSSSWRGAFPAKVIYRPGI